MSAVIAWRPGMPLSQEAIGALRMQTIRQEIPPSEAAVYLRAGLSEAERLGDTESAKRILPLLAVMCQLTGALAEAIRFLRRHREIDPGPEPVDFLIVTLAFNGFARSALREQRQATGLGFPSTEARLGKLTAAVERSLLPVGSLLAIHHDAKRTRP